MKRMPIFIRMVEMTEILFTFRSSSHR